MNWTPTQEQLEAITGASTLESHPPTVVEYALPDADYRSTGGLNQSFLKLMDPMPASACSFFDRLDSSEFLVGRYVHQAILTPHDPVPKFAIFPDKLRGNARELWEAEQVKAGFQVFTLEEYREWSGCVRSLSGNARIQELLRDGNSEVSCFRTVEIDGVRFRIKTRIDWIPWKGTSLVNFKTTMPGGIGEKEFKRSLYGHNYGMQAAFELMVHNLCFPEDQRTEYVWPVVEKKSPHCIRIYVATNERLREFREIIEEKLFVFARCIRNGCFEGDDLDYKYI